MTDKKKDEKKGTNKTLEIPDVKMGGKRKIGGKKIMGMFASTEILRSQS